MHDNIVVGCDTPTTASSADARCILAEVHAAQLADAVMHVSSEFYCNRLKMHCTSNQPAVCAAQAPCCFDQCAALSRTR